MKTLTLGGRRMLGCELSRRSPTQALPIEIKRPRTGSYGRYVMPGRIISFGVVMSSTWRNASGDIIGASSTLQIQSSTVKPSFMCLP